MKNVNGVVVGSIQDIEIRNMKVSHDTEYELWLDMYTSSITVSDTLYGDIQPGKTILVMQHGDNKEQLYEDILNNGGYLEKGKTYLLFLVERTDQITGETYYIINLAGQYLLDKEGDFLEKSKDAVIYWENINSVEEMKKTLSSLVIS